MAKARHKHAEAPHRARPALPPGPAWFRRPRVWLAFAAGGLAAWLLSFLIPYLLFTRHAPPVSNIADVDPLPRRFDNGALAPYATSEACRECHPAQFDKWASSHHALAERPINPSNLDRAAFDPARTFKHGSQETSVSLQPDAAPAITTLGFKSQPADYKPSRVIGVSPLRQFLLERDAGRVQTFEATYDPHKSEWFNVYGNEDRKPGEWGHWTGRGMNWNSMCAACHNTRLLKNYDAHTDSYHTAMAEMGVGCESCHGPMKDHVAWQRAHPLASYSASSSKPTTRPADPTYRKPSPVQVMDNCATCHSRRSEITGDFIVGDSYFNHYLLGIPDQSDLWYPDGQVRDEDYEYTSFRSSKMHAAGVRCVDCHDPHGGKTILSGNNLCMRCHNGSYPRSPVISPLTHTNHELGSAGSQCINCHMPQTVYMQRHARHDHAFTIPDPLLTKQHGIPNACNRCHTDKDADWAIDAVDDWYGKRMDRPTRTRAQWIARARAADATARQPLLGLLHADPQPFWRSVAAALLGQWATDPSVSSALIRATEHEDPLLRENAARSLAPAAQNQDARARDALTKLLADPSRNVRIRAAWALKDSIDPRSSIGEELQHFLDINSDQPTGAMQVAEYHLARRDPAKAHEWIARAVRWDPNSAPLRDALAYVLSLLQRPDEALAQMKHAVALAPNEADYHYRLGLAHHENRNPSEALAALRKAVQLDPDHGRAWYNLGLALNAADDKEPALTALANAEKNSPGDPDPPYARATVLAQLGRTAEARQAAQHALSIRPDYAPAAQLLQALGR